MVSSERLKQLEQNQTGGGGAPVIPLPEPFQDQNVHSLMRMRAEMEKVQNDPSLAPDQRAALMDENRGRFDGLASVINPPKETLTEVKPNLAEIADLATVKKSEPAPPQLVKDNLQEKVDKDEEDEEEDISKKKDKHSVAEWFSMIEDDLTSNLDRGESIKMKRILKKIKGRGDVLRICKTGELVYKKQVIEGSDFSDLFKFLYLSNHKPKSVSGLNELMSGLSELDVKAKDVSTSNASKLLTKSPKKKPPRNLKGYGISSFLNIGKRPRILELYSV